MNVFFSKALKYAAIGIVAVPLSIVTHELGHYAMYHVFGASNIRLHSVSVSADKQALSNLQIAIANIVGPLISYLTIGIALFVTRIKYVPFWIVLGLAAPIGRIVNVVYVFFRALGYHPNPNFDEYNFSPNLNIEPLWISIATVLLIAAATYLLLRRVFAAGGLRELLAVGLALGSGLLVWAFAGGLLLP
jgi:hypothetical protein